jgi:hypothetical protein
LLLGTAYPKILDLMVAKYQNLIKTTEGGYQYSCPQKSFYSDSKLLKNADKSLLTKSIASSGLSSMLSLIKRKIAP